MLVTNGRPGGYRHVVVVAVVVVVVVVVAAAAATALRERPEPVLLGDVELGSRVNYSRRSRRTARAAATAAMAGSAHALWARPVTAIPPLTSP